MVTADRDRDKHADKVTMYRNPYINSTHSIPNLFYFDRLFSAKLSFPLFYFDPLFSAKLLMSRFSRTFFSLPYSAAFIIASPIVADFAIMDG